jgi:hypothetical protein
LFAILECGLTLFLLSFQMSRKGGEMMIGEVGIEEIGIVDTEVEEMNTVVEGGDTTGITIVVGGKSSESIHPY